MSIINKYKTLNAPVKASLWFVICGFLQKGIAFITTPVFTRIMTSAEFGRYSVYNSWYSILYIIVTLNLAAGVYTRGIIKNEEDKDSFSSSMVGLSTFSIIIFAIIFAVFHNQISSVLDLTTYLIVLMFIEMWASTVYQFWSNRQRVEYKYKKLVLLTLVFTLIRPIAAVMSIWVAPVDRQVEARVSATVLINILLFTGLFIAIVAKGKTLYKWKYWKYALSFNLPLIPHYLSQIVLNQADRLMINSICGKEEVGYYSVAYSISMVMTIFNNSVSSTMNPWIYRSIKKKDYKNIAQVSYLVLAIIALINFAVIAVAPEVLKIMAPGSYGGAIWVIPPITASVYFMFLYNLFATYEYYFEKTHYVMIASLSGAIINIVLNEIFITKFGYIAAGYTTLTCYLIYAIAHYLFMRATCRANIGNIKIYDVKIIMLIGCALIVSSGVMLFLYPYVIIRYLLLLAGLVLLLANREKVTKTWEYMKNG